MSVPGISWSGVLIRVALAVALVFVTYNPTGHSFYHWLTAPEGGSTALKALLGVILLIGWAICLRTVFVALGWLGMILGTALTAPRGAVFIDCQARLSIGLPSRPALDRSTAVPSV